MARTLCFTVGLTICAAMIFSRFGCRRESFAFGPPGGAELRCCVHRGKVTQNKNFKLEFQRREGSAARAIVQSYCGPRIWNQGKANGPGSVDSWIFGLVPEASSAAMVMGVAARRRYLNGKGWGYRPRWVEVVAPFQGLSYFSSFNPGRCPGLICFAPLGLMVAS